MPKRQSPKLWKLFKLQTNGKQKCTICGTCVRSDASSLQRHIEGQHITVFERIRPFLNNNKTNKRPASASVPTKRKVPAQSPLRVFLTRKDLQEAALATCLNFYTPFSVLNIPEVRKIFDTLTDAISLETEKPCPKFTSTNVRALVTKYANQIRQTISGETKNRMLSVKIEGAPRGSLTNFAINVQYMLNGTITVRNLGVRAVKTASIEENLTTVVMEVLGKYNINLAQVVTVTCNKRPNVMLFATETGRAEELGEDIFNDEMFEETDNDNYFEKLRAFVDEGCHYLDMKEETILCLRCAAHTMQLCALDILIDPSDDSIKTAFFKVRDVVKHLRLESNDFGHIFTQRNITMPDLDSPTRWLSAIDMFEKLLLAKPYFDTEHIRILGEGKNALTVDDDFWQFVKVYCTALGPLKRALAGFQEKSLHLSEFYKEWLKVKLLVENKMQEYAKLNDAPYLAVYERLTAAIATREMGLFDNDALHGCLYMDPRFQETMSKASKSRGKAFLKDLWSRKCALDVIAANELMEPQAPVDLGSLDDDALAQKLVEQHFGMQELANKPKNKTPKTISHMIDNLKLQRQPMSFDVKTHWESWEIIKPELYALYEIVFAIPPTQVSEGRALLALQSVLTRNCSSDIWKDILAVKLNYDLMPILDLNDEQLNDLLK